MKDVVLVGVIECLANLAADVEQVPDGEAFLARQHGGNAVALDVFHGGAELAVDFSRAVDQRDVGTAEVLGGFCFLQNALHHLFGMFAEHIQAKRFQRERLARLRIISFVDASRIRFCELSKNFEAADFRRHCFLPSPGEAPANAPRKEHTGSDSGVGNHKDSLGRKRLRVTKVLGNGARNHSPQRHRDTENHNELRATSHGLRAKRSGVCSKLAARSSFLR